MEMHKKHRYDNGEILLKKAVLWEEEQVLVEMIL